MVEVTFVYQSNFPMEDCVGLLMQPPLHFRINWLFSRDYEIERASGNELLITFTKGYNLSDHRTKYKMTFGEQAGTTTITMKFISEKGISPFPLVTDWEITKLLKERIDAKRI